LARTLSGVVAQVGGWRLVFALAAVGMLLLSLALSRMLPKVKQVDPMSYRAALRSVLTLIAREPVLRQRMALGGLTFAGFSVLWTSIAFLLSSKPYGYGEGVIGLFGLAGAAGALISPVVGRLADRGHNQLAATVLLVLVLVSWGLLALGATSLVALIAGIVVLDLGVQGTQSSNQAAIYGLVPEARGRLTTAFVVSVFLGGIAGSAVSSAVYAAAGWHAVCAVGAGLAALAIVAFAATRRLGVVAASD
jgi:predicted MFS family arabinose efflux permease